MDSKALELIISAMDRSQRFLEYQDHRDLLLSVWKFAVDEMMVIPDLDTLCIAILAFSKYKKSKYQQMASRLVSQLMADNDAILELRSRRREIECHQILRALGNIDDLNGMWSFYDVIYGQNAVRYHVPN